MNKQTKPKSPIGSYLIYAGAALLFIFLGLILGTFSYSLAHTVGSRGGESGPLATLAPWETPGSTRISIDDYAQQNQAPIDVLPQWDGSSRVNILVMGLDYRDWSGWENQYFRTDTMLVLTIDPVTKTAGVLSIPRDLWAAIPGFSPQKINTAHYFGDMYKYPGGGPALAVKTVENVIGVHIDYYVRLDFNAFVEFIDLIGGVKVNVTETIELEVIGKDYDTVLQPGVYTLPGDLALAYARNRYNRGGDFDRARRQQQIIMGIRDRLLNPMVFSMLLQNAPELYTQFTQGVLTNIPLSDAIALGALATQVEAEDITMRVIGEQDVIYGSSPDDLSILIPLPDKIRQLRDEVFASNGALSPAMEGDPLVLMQLENARIHIQNATNDSALGQRTANYLTGLGANVVSVENLGTINDSSGIIDHTGSPYTLSYLTSLMNISSSRLYVQLAMDSSMDVVLILGTQWQYNNPMP